jgi:uncharacterized protein (TIGR03118 family)
MKAQIQTSATAKMLTIVFCIIMLATGCKKEMPSDNDFAALSATEKSILKDFQLVSLVGDDDEYDPLRIDPFLVNGWGIAFGATGNAWISAEGSGTSTVYDSEGNEVLAPVAIPSPTALTGGHPTGIVFNGSSTDFLLPNGNPAIFIFVGLDGVISGWNPGNLTQAIKVLDESDEAVYTGLAIASSNGQNYIYGANFKGGEIEVYDKDWLEIDMDFEDPDLPDGYSPFNIQEAGGKLYVMYAKFDEEEGEEEIHPGYGLVDVYNTDGSFVRRFTSFGKLNAPWGLAIAPAGFFGAGSESSVLVGNFGDGRINVYSMDGQFVGPLRSKGKPIEIEGLWGITFPPSTSTIDQGRLYFAAGPDDEVHGLFGYIAK